ncbi:hypothetical protein BgiBS90_019400, partial [Biomphalaria glabrata]
CENQQTPREDRLTFLKKNRNLLEEALCPDDFIGHFYQNGIINELDKETFQSNLFTNRLKNKLILDIIMHSDDDCYAVFLKAVEIAGCYNDINIVK